MSHIHASLQACRDDPHQLGLDCYLSGNPIDEGIITEAIRYPDRTTKISCQRKTTIELASPSIVYTNLKVSSEYNEFLIYSIVHIMCMISSG